jgi:hypothetical protein
LFFDILITFSLLASILGVLSATVYFLQKKKKDVILASLKFSFSFFLLAVGIFIVYIIGQQLIRLIKYFFKFIKDHIPQPHVAEHSASGLIMIIISVLVILLFAVTIILFYLLCKHLIKKMTVPLKPPASEAEFRLAIKKFEAIAQVELLALANPQGMNMKAESFYKLLVEIENDIKEEPAISKYYAKMAEIQESLRQSRIG